MKIKYDFNCETCKSKDICKYYKETSKYCEKELDVKLKPKEESNKENLVITINCKHYNNGETVLNYPYGVRSGGNSNYPNYPLNGGITNITDNISYDTDGSKNLDNVITTKKHI